MRRLGFSAKWIALDQECLSSISYSFFINGSPMDAVVPQRGIRRVYPLSPYLFLFCTEAFLNLLDAAEIEGSLKGVRCSWHCPPMSHLLFADDGVIFCEATLNYCAVLFKAYEKGSG
ncbi:hypothetical protein ACOSP7_019399 [Xanthoceras sorbifolium]